VGSRSALRNQVAHMLDLVQRGVADIRVLPWNAGAAPIQASFTIMEFEDDEDPTIVYAEVPGGARYLEEEKDLSFYRTAWSKLIERSQPLEEHVK
jgi:hypothetical protein